MKQHKVSVGILSRRNVLFYLSGKYKVNDVMVEGKCSARINDDGDIEVTTSAGSFKSKNIKFTTNSWRSKFTLKDVVIGIDFHWERREDQDFVGDLALIADGDKLHAVNELDVEEYLKSVISSEMSSTSNVELLKAHAVISRSWLMAQIVKNKNIKESDQTYESTKITDTEILKWYDKEDHTLFDVCADDHCQRYQGTSRVETVAAMDAVNATSGLVLKYEGEICDARYSKTCGGISEAFHKTWEPVEYPYLTSVVDNENAPEGFNTDFNNEDNAEKWIRNSPDSFCNTTDREALGQVLNDYDQETTDFYRWKVEYSQKELSELIKDRSGIDFGDIISIEPLERGYSGRLIKIKIVGTKKTMSVGKELEIRKYLSKSHLYSSAFVVDTEGEGEVPEKFILRGAGWGHGVGLCQIGAAVMANRGYKFDEILLHYFKGAKLEKL